MNVRLRYSESADNREECECENAETVKTGIELYWINTFPAVSG